MQRVMGLDISTTTVGVFIIEFNDDGSYLKPIHHSYIKPDKKKEELDRLLEVKRKIIDLANKYNVTKFAVEEYIKYMKAKSGAKTILPLAIINRTVCLALYETFGIYPSIFNVLKIRHEIKTDHFPDKEEIPDLLNQKLGTNFPYYFNNKSKPTVENNDVADAGACAYCYILTMNDPVKPKKKKKKKKAAVKK